MISSKQNRFYTTIDLKTSLDALDSLLVVLCAETNSISISKRDNIDIIGDQFEIKLRHQSRNNSLVMKNVILCYVKGNLTSFTPSTNAPAST